MDDASLILAWRPGKKRGVYLLKKHYDLVSSLILSLLQENKMIVLNDLIEEVHELSLRYDIDLAWVLLQVKSDMEARELIKINVVGPDRTQVIKMNPVRRTRFNYFDRGRKPLVDKPL